jgi:hypothetical protein
LNNLASTALMSKNYDKSISYYKESLNIAEKHLPPDDPKIVAVRNNIKTCEGLNSGEKQLPPPEAEKKDANNYAQDLVPPFVKESAISQLSHKNIIISDLQAQPAIPIDDKGIVFPYIALSKVGGESEGNDGIKIIVLFAAIKDASKQNKYIFQQCRVISFQTYTSTINDGGVELLKQELKKIFPDIYS